MKKIQELKGALRQSPPQEAQKSLTTQPLAVKLEPPVLQALDVSHDLVPRQPGCLWLSWKPWEPGRFMQQECELRYQPQLRGANWTLVRQKTTLRRRWGIERGQAELS